MGAGMSAVKGSRAAPKPGSGAKPSVVPAPAEATPVAACLPAIVCMAPVAHRAETQALR